MKSVDNIMTLWNLMAEAEKRELCLRIADRAMAEGLADEKQVLDAVQGGKKTWRRSRKRHWVRRVDGIDAEKKGVFRLVGKWAYDVAKGSDEGDLLAIGWEDDDGEKHYLLGRHETGATAHVREEEIENVAVLERYDSYARLEKDVCRYLADA